jgi:3-hydroxy acid dehydrogenase/malonic semialdehyde reductase
VCQKRDPTFAQAGANLVLLARRTDALQKVAEACQSASANIKVATIGQFDVGDKAQVAGLLEKIPQDLRQVDVLGTHDALRATQTN